MNRTIATIALIAAATGSAFADDLTIEPKEPFVSSRTRAEVMAEQRQFQQAGVIPWADEYNQLTSFQSTASREQVRAAYIASRDEVAAMNSEDSGSAYLTAHTRTVAPPVMAAATTIAAE